MRVRRCDSPSCVSMLWSMLALAPCVACASRPAVQPPSQTAPSTRTVLRLSTTANCNGERPVYYMIRALSDEAAFSEGYDASLARAVGSKADRSVLARGLVAPRESTDLTLATSDAMDLGVYVFFTAQGSRWKLRVPRPLPAHLSLIIDESRVRPRSTELE